MTGVVLVLNAGSSNLKFAAYQLEAVGPKLAFQGQIESSGDTCHITAKDADGADLAGLERCGTEGGQDGHLASLLAFTGQRLGANCLRAVGHRVVHGGPSFTAPMVIDDDVLAQLDALCPLAPLHQAHNLAAVRAVRALRPDLLQIACFDTAFHHGQAEVVTRFALPRAWHDKGIRRYGFHGLSYEYISDELRRRDPGLAAGKVIIAHLGNGASLCAVQDGVSVDTTMGLTTLDGLMMGTRCGALDPGVALYLQQHEGMTVQAIETLLYEQSGLLGVSALSSDMRVLLKSTEAAVIEAVDLFCFRIARDTGALMSSMGGLDGIVFTGGIGEHAPEVRARVAQRLAWTGLELDPLANVQGAGLISRPSSRLRAWVLQTDEQSVIAKHCAKLALPAMPISHGS